MMSQCGVKAARASPAGAPPANMMRLAGGNFTMGSDRHYPEEGPAHPRYVEGFWIDPHPVTNKEFSAFVAATGYVTVAEMPPSLEDYPDLDPAMRAPGSLVFKTKPGTRRPVDRRQWWTLQPGANWRQPHGSGSEALPDHPVVHVSYLDAQAYSTWLGKELPTEAEWEFAARGGLDGADYAWGDQLSPDGRMMANYWQGHFPYENLLLDGYATTSPVGVSPPNGFGLYDMIGNVWEWTTDPFVESHRWQTCCGRPSQSENRGQGVATRDVMHVLKGGSYLCAGNYCERYRPAARSAQSLDTSSCHIGFRCVVRG